MWAIVLAAGALVVAGCGEPETTVSGSAAALVEAIRVVEPRAVPGVETPPDPGVPIVVNAPAGWDIRVVYVASPCSGNVAARIDRASSGPGHKLLLDPKSFRGACDDSLVSWAVDLRTKAPLEPLSVSLTR